MLRFGTIAEVDPAAPRVRVETGGLVTGWLPFFAARAGEDSEWNPPSLGEQCMVFSPSGDPATGAVLAGLPCDRYPAPDDNPAHHRRAYRDGAVIEYDTDSHTLSATLPDGGRAHLSAPGGVSIIGDVTITGTVQVSVDVVASGISLVNHLTTGVTSGNSLSGKPQ